MRYGAVIIPGRPTSIKGGLRQAGGGAAAACVNRLLKTITEAGVDDTIVVTGSYECSSTDSKTVLEGAREGIRSLVGKCDRIFICPAGSSSADRKTLLEMMSRNADVVLPVRHGAAANPLLISDMMARWILIYNGSRGLSGAWESLVRTQTATLSEVELAQDSLVSIEPEYKKEYKSVINWV